MTQSDKLVIARHIEFLIWVAGESVQAGLMNQRDKYARELGANGWLRYCKKWERPL